MSWLYFRNTHTRGFAGTPRQVGARRKGRSGPLSEQERVKLIGAFEQGFSVRGAARLLGIDRKTAARHLRWNDRIICPCGKALPHNGWCSPRVDRSKSRQDLLKRLAPISDETLARWDGPKPTAARPARHYRGNFDL